MESAVASVKQAMKVWESKTCIRFVERTNEKAYLEFFRGQGWVNMNFVYTCTKCRERNTLLKRTDKVKPEFIAKLVCGKREERAKLLSVRRIARLNNWNVPTRGNDRTECKSVCSIIIRSFVRSFARLFVCSLAHSLVLSFVRSFTRSFSSRNLHLNLETIQRMILSRGT